MKGRNSGIPGPALPSSKPRGAGCGVTPKNSPALPGQGIIPKKNRGNPSSHSYLLPCDTPRGCSFQSSSWPQPLSISYSHREGTAKLEELTAPYDPSPAGVGCRDGLGAAGDSSVPLLLPAGLRHCPAVLEAGGEMGSEGAVEHAGAGSTGKRGFCSHTTSLPSPRASASPCPAVLPQPAWKMLPCLSFPTDGKLDWDQSAGKALSMGSGREAANRSLDMRPGPPHSPCGCKSHWEQTQRWIQPHPLSLMDIRAVPPELGWGKVQAELSAGWELKAT